MTPRRDGGREDQPKLASEIRTVSSILTTSLSIPPAHSVPADCVRAGLSSNPRNSSGGKGLFLLLWDPVNKPRGRGTEVRRAVSAALWLSFGQAHVNAAQRSDL